MEVSPFLALYFSAPSAAVCCCFDTSKARHRPPRFSYTSQGKHLCQNETNPKLLTLRAGHASTKTTTSSGTGDIGSIMTTVGQGHLCPRTLDTAHNHVVSADVSVPVPGFLGRKAEKGISHTLQCLVDGWGNIHPPVTCILPPGKTNARAHAIKETDLAKGCWSREELEQK